MQETLRGDALAGLDFDSREQLYYQLYEILFQSIIGGVYQVGDCIPSETELMNEYGVSRTTARRAMGMLEDEGLVVRRRGRGSEVVALRPKSSPQHVTGYVRKNFVDRAIPEKRMVSFERLASDDEVARSLGLSKGVPVFRLERVRMSDDVPFYLEINYLDALAMPDLPEHDFSRESLRAFYASAYHISWSHAKEQVSPVVADERMAGLLQISVGDPLLCVKRISFDESDAPREFVIAYYRGDFYRLEVDFAI